VPQDGDLLAQASTQVGILVRRGERVVERIEQPLDPAQGDEQGAPPCLGRVCGQHGVDLEASDQRGDGLGAMVRGQPRDRLGHGVVDRPPAGAPRPCPEGAIRWLVRG
jgi:hypothetical protein